MSVTVYPARLFGGRNCGVSYDDVAGTISIEGVSVALSTLSIDLQDQWADVVGLGSTSVQTTGVPAFGGSQVGQVVGNILDATPSWRSAVQAAVEGYAASISPYGDPEQFIH